MLRRLSLLLVLASTARALAQSPAIPTTEQLMQWLETAHRRMNLVTDTSPTFHIVATAEDYPQDKPIQNSSFEEFWRSPLDYKTTITVNGVAYTERHTPQALVLLPPVTSQWHIPSSIPLAELGLFNPFPKFIEGSHRVFLQPQYHGITNLDCIGVEPELPGVPPEVHVAYTTYCLARGSHLLRRIDLPNDSTQIDLDDITPFSDRYIARTITLHRKDRVIGRVRISTLEPAADLSSLDQPLPADAKHYPPRRQDTSYAFGGTTSGQVLYHPPTYAIHDKAPTGTMQLLLQVDTTGAVTDVQILHSANPPLNSWAIEWGKKVRFYTAYQGDHPIPFTTHFTLDFGGKDE